MQLSFRSLWWAGLLFFFSSFTTSIHLLFGLPLFLLPAPVTTPSSAHSHDSSASRPQNFVDLASRPHCRSRCHLQTSVFTEICLYLHFVTLPIAGVNEEFRADPWCTPTHRLANELTTSKIYFEGACVMGSVSKPCRSNTKGEESCGLLQISSTIINPIKTCLWTRVCCLGPMHRHTAQKNSPSAPLLLHNGSLFVQNELCCLGLIKWSVTPAILQDWRWDIWG